MVSGRTLSQQRLQVLQGFAALTLEAVEGVVAAPEDRDEGVFGVGGEQLGREIAERAGPALVGVDFIVPKCMLNGIDVKRHTHTRNDGAIRVCVVDWETGGADLGFSKS